MIFRVLSFVFVVIFSLSSSLYAAAGVLFTFDDHTVLVGKETRGKVKFWSDFGGGRDPKDGRDNRKTALREGNEETAGTFGLKYHQVARAPSVIHNHRVGSYEMFFVRIPGSKPSIQELINNGNVLKKKFGRHAHVEKIDYKYVDAQALVNAAWGNHLLPGTNDPMFAPFIACIKKDASNPKGALNTLIRSPKKAAPIRPLLTKAAAVRPSPPRKVAPPRPHLRKVVPPRPHLRKVAPPRARHISKRHSVPRIRYVARCKVVPKSRRQVCQQRCASRVRHGRNHRHGLRPRHTFRHHRSRK
jgi:hypothetical protein